MVASTIRNEADSPLHNLTLHERELVIEAIGAAMPPAEAVRVIATLAGTPAEVAALPYALQRHAVTAILAALPAGTNAVVASRLGIGKRSDEEYLEEVLTDEEKADHAFRQRIEDEARRRGIQRWLAALRLRDEGKTIEEYVAAHDRAALREQTRGDCLNQEDSGGTGSL